MKSHKAKGKVNGRPIHDGTSSPLNNAPSWMSETFEEHIQIHCPHIVRDSRDLVRQLQTVSIRPGEILVAFDIKDYYPGANQQRIENIAYTTYLQTVSGNHEQSKSLLPTCKMVTADPVYSRTNITNTIQNKQRCPYRFEVLRRNVRQHLRYI